MVLSPSNSTVTSQPSLSTRLSALSSLPRFFRLVWQTSPPLMGAASALRLTRSALPVAILYVGKLIVDGIVEIGNGAPVPHSWLWKLVALELGLALLSDALGRATALVDALLGDRFPNDTSVGIMQNAATLRPEAV